MKSMENARKRLRTDEPVTPSLSAACCRTCLATERPLFALHETPQLVNICVGLDLSTTDMVCFECRARLNSFIKFRSRAQRARKVLSRVPASARSSLPELIQIFFSSGVKCLSPLTQVAVSPYEFIYMGDAAVQIKYHSDFEDDNSPKSEEDSDSELLNSVMDDNKGENANDTCLLLQVGDNMESLISEEHLVDVELEKKVKDEETTSRVIYEDDSNVGLNVSYEDANNADSDADANSESDLPQFQLSGRAYRSRPNPKIIMHYTKVEITLAEVLSQMDATRNSTRHSRFKYKCDLCAVAFFTENKFKLHQLLHSERRGSFACPICQQRFKNSHELQVHTDAHYVRYQCRYCEKIIENYTQMYSHYNDLHESNKVRKCDKCDKTFATRSETKYHIEKYHRVHPTFKCEICHRVYATKGILHRHMMLHDETVPELECGFCHKMYKGEAHLKTHVRNTHHDEPGETYCQDCDIQFQYPRQYKKHLRTSKHLTPEDYLYVCDYCGKKYAEKNLLQVHIQAAHLKLANHPCDVCEQKFHTKRYLQRHKKHVHSAEPLHKRHVCHVCAKAFTGRSMLEQHMNSHSGVKPYHCEPCNKSFTYRNALYAHNRTIHLNAGMVAQKTIVIIKKANPRQ